VSLRDIPQRPGRKAPPDEWIGGEQAPWYQGLAPRFQGLAVSKTVPKAVTGRISDAFPGQGREVVPVRQALIAWLRQQDFEVQDWSDNETYFVQVRTPSQWRRNMGMDTHVTIELSQVDGDLIISTYPARWRDRDMKIVLLPLHYYTAWTSFAYGVAKERMLVFKARKFIADQVGAPKR
jgi:hypothetical protein